MYTLPDTKKEINTMFIKMIYSCVTGSTKQPVLFSFSALYSSSHLHQKVPSKNTDEQNQPSTMFLGHLQSVLWTKDALCSKEEFVPYTGLSSILTFDTHDPFPWISAVWKKQGN